MTFQSVSALRTTRAGVVPVTLLLGLGLLGALSARAEVTVSLFAGKSVTDNGDLTLKQGSTRLKFRNVEWEDESFEDPIFYGARLGYWFDNHPEWGLSIDFTHAKTYLNDKDTVAVQGERNGVVVDGYEPIRDSIQSFNLSHGLNMITFNGMYRWFAAGQRDQTLLGRLQFYSGLGAGFSIPHVEAMIDGLRTYEYQAAAGPVVNGMVGLNYDLYEFLSGFLEYKLSYADVDADLKGGGSISAESVTHQFIFGITGRFNLW